MSAPARDSPQRLAAWHLAEGANEHGLGWPFALWFCWRPGDAALGGDRPSLDSLGLDAADRAG